MGVLLFVLSLIFVVLCTLGIVLLVQSASSLPKRYLGLSMLLLGLGVFQALYFMVSSSMRIHVLLLLPFNIVFLPYYFSVLHIESLSGTRIFHRYYRLLVKYLAFAEILVHLLPLGVILYTGEYSRSILDFLWRIRTVGYSLFVLLSIAGTLVAASRWGRQGRGGKQGYAMVQPAVVLFWVATVLISLSLAVSLVLPLLARPHRMVFYIPQALAGVFFVAWGVYTLFSARLHQVAVDTAAVASKSYSIYYASLIQMLEVDKIYRNPQLKIADVAGQLSITPNYMSRIISESSEMDFNDLVNSYRVMEVIEKIKGGDYKKKTLLSLALEAGFSSKSNFQSVFKKATGKTPSDYKQESLKQQG